MSKIKNIIQGWKNLILEDEKLLPLFESRFQICQKCDSNKFQVCTECGCFIPAKTRSPEENCPVHKWKPIHYIDNGFEYVLKSEIPSSIQKYFKDEEIELNKWLEFLKENNNEKK